MKMPPFDASGHGDSDDMCFIFLRSVNMEYDQNFKLQKSICANIVYMYMLSTGSVRRAVDVESMYNEWNGNVGI